MHPSPSFDIWFNSYYLLLLVPAIVAMIVIIIVICSAYGLISGTEMRTAYLTANQEVFIEWMDDSNMR